MNWLEKRLGFLFGASRSISAPVKAEKVDPLKTRDSRIATIPARAKPATFYDPRFMLDDGLLEVFDIRVGFAQAIPSRPYGSVWLTAFQNGLADVPLSRLEDIAAILEGELEPEPKDQLKLLYTGGVPNVFRARGKNGEICEGCVLYSRLSGFRWFFKGRLPGGLPWDSKSTRVVFPICPIEES